MSFTFEALKSGLVSKSYEVALWTIRLFSRLALDLHHNNELVNIWQWFAYDPNCGFETILLAIKRHPDLKSNAI